MNGSGDRLWFMSKGAKPPGSASIPLPPLSVAQLADELRTALGGEPYRALARSLAPSLLDAATNYRPLELETESALRRLREQAEIAGQVRRLTADLRACLQRCQPHVAEARERGHLQSRPAREASLADYCSWGSAVRAETVLARLEAEAAQWAAQALADGRRPPGKPLGDSDILTEFVALRLSKAGVKLTKAREGKFAKVLTVVRRVAGLPEIEVYRHVRRVLRSTDSGGPLAQALSAGTQSPAKDSR